MPTLLHLLHPALSFLEAPAPLGRQVASCCEGFSVILYASAGLLMPLVCSWLACAEGVLYAEKDFNLKDHPELPGVKNLYVIKLMQSFKSKELCKEQFAWRHYYWCALVRPHPARVA